MPILDRADNILQKNAAEGGGNRHHQEHRKTDHQNTRANRQDRINPPDFTDPGQCKAVRNQKVDQHHKP